VIMDLKTEIKNFASEVSEWFKDFGKKSLELLEDFGLKVMDSFERTTPIAKIFILAVLLMIMGLAIPVIKFFLWIGAFLFAVYVLYWILWVWLGFK